MKKHNDKEEVGIKALCLLVKDDRVLASRGHDDVKGEDFYRLLGGGLNFFESSEDGVRREIREELKSELTGVSLLKVVENIFMYNGNKGHQIAFIYSGKLENKKLYDQNPIHIIEEDYEFDAEWIPIEKVLSGEIRLYPEANYAELFNKNQLTKND